MASESSQDFNITTVGYYKRDNDMNVTVDAQPRCVNTNYNRLLELQEPGDYAKENEMNLRSPEVKRDGNVENFFESLLNYISIKGFGEKKPLFVTYKQILADIATKRRMQTFHIVSHMDMIFISYKRLERDIPGSDETEQKRIQRARKAMEYTIDANFAHYWTKESKDEEIPADYATSNCKAVMKCDVDICGKKELVVYSAQIDALEKESGRHVHIRTSGIIDLWTLRSLHWKMFFGNEKTMILGTRAVSNELSNCALRSVEVLKFEDVSAKLEKNKIEKRDKHGVSNGAPFQKWTVDHGKRRVRHFLSEVKKACNDSDGCFLATETGRTWSFEKVDEEHDAVREFVNLVKSKMAVWKTNFPNDYSD